ncbi:hypothetical protein ACF1AX_37775 [Streptomyces sp. NPDC014802]
MHAIDCEEALTGARVLRPDVRAPLLAAASTGGAYDSGGYGA